MSNTISIHCVEEVAEISVWKTPNLNKPKQHYLHGNKLEVGVKIQGFFGHFLWTDPFTSTKA